jgi:GNAT superfamily N-acetyltransferase
MTENPSVEYGSLVSVRPREAADEDYLFPLYCAIRAPEFASVPMPDALKQQIFRMQYDAQIGTYSARFPGSDYNVILRAGQPVGRIWVARLADEIRLVDIALAPEARNVGIGTFLVSSLQSVAREAGKPIRCTVHRESPASLRFHMRLGFVISSENQTDYRLEWDPGH